MDLASSNGYIEVVKFLHSIGVQCTTYAINMARKNGHLEIVKFLEENKKI